MTDIYAFLAGLNISYDKCEHPPVFTCEESRRLVPPLPGAHTKNLFLKDDKGKRFFLVVVDCDKSVGLKELGKKLEVKGLTFASPEQLKKFLGVDPGSATVLGLAFDTDATVEVIIDKYVWESEMIQCHPLINTATLVIPHEGLEKFLKATNHQAKVEEVPARNV